MKAEILSTGDEVRVGALADTNAAHIADALESAGVHVLRHTCVGDDLDMLVAAMREIGNRAEVALSTGGLGPTTDDLTAEAAAIAAGVSLAEDPAAMASMKAWFAARGWTPSGSNLKQALIPQGAEALPNPVGTAAGFAVTIGRCRFFFLPGVPHEMRRMLADQALPRIRALAGDTLETRTVRVLSTVGLSESGLGETVADLEKHFPSIKLGLRAAFPEIHVRLYAAGQDPATVASELDRAEAWVRERLGDAVFSNQGHSLPEAVGHLLREHGASLALAESCTGGLIATRITDTPGSSAYFRLSAVTYANEAKVAVLGVKPETLAAHGAVSEETAREMAEGVRRVSGADYGLAVSGIAGPDGGTPEKPVGTVCLALASATGTRTERLHRVIASRLMYKQWFATQALNLLRRALVR